MKIVSRFLPHNPDVLDLLVQQAAVTIGGLSAFVDWAQGVEGADLIVREAEHEADTAKRALRLALRDAFVTPIGAEDIFVMSSRLDAVLTGAKDAVREAEVMAIAPDAATIDMAMAIGAGIGHLVDAFDALHGGRGSFEKATDAADASKVAVRSLEHIYRVAMCALLDNDDLREVTGRRELYRRFSRMSEAVIEVGDRVWYAAIKEA